MAERWNIRTVASEEDKQLFNEVYRMVRDTQGSKANGGFCDDDAWLFTPDQQRAIYKATVRYACTYKGDFDFMVSVRERTLKSLPSERQMWGILNCMKADFHRLVAAKRQAQVSVAVAEGSQAAGIAAHKAMALGGTFNLAPLAQPTVAAPAGPAVANGYYTVNMGDGTHVTLRLDDDFREDAPEGSQCVAYLNGPQNDADYASFGFVQGTQARVWKKYQDKVARQQAALDILLGADTDKAREYGMAYAIESGRCARCGRLLTVEASVAQGLGPECAKKGWNA